MTTIQFYVDNGDIASGVFMLMIFYETCLANEPKDDPHVKELRNFLNGQKKTI